MTAYRTCILISLCIAAGAIAAPAPTRATTAITADTTPPPPRVENVAARDGYVWAPGYWDWNRRSYHWVTGSYIFERRRYHWVADQWEQAGGHWYHQLGRWERVEPSTRLLSSSQTPVKAR